MEKWSFTRLRLLNAAVMDSVLRTLEVHNFNSLNISSLANMYIFGRFLKCLLEITI